MNLGQKLLVSYVLIALIACAAGAFGLYYVDAVGDDGVRVGERLAPLGDAAMEIKLSATKAHLLFEEIMSGDANESIDEVWRLLDESEWYCDAILRGGRSSEGVYFAAEDADVRAKIEDVKKRLVSFAETARRRHADREGGASGAGTAADQAFDREYQRFITLADEAEEIIHRKMDAGIRALRESSAEAWDATVVVMVLAVLFALIAGVMFSRSITRPVVAVASASERMARRELGGSDDAQLALGRKDEIGTLASAFTSMRENLRQALEAMQRSASGVTARATELSTTAKQYGSAATEQAATLAELSQTSATIQSTGQKVVENAKRVVEAAEVARDGGRRGLDALEDAVGANRVVGQRIDDISTKILELSQQNAQIGEIIETVNDFAEQSNLLAINASIEAAKAGEEGLGFSVVASEVRTLAEQSKAAAKQIRSVLQEIQRTTQSVVYASEEATKRAVDSHDSIESVRTVVIDLAQALENNSGRAKEISDEAVRQFDSVAQTAQALADLEAAGRENLAGVRQLQEAAAALKEVGGELKLLADSYRL